MWIARDKSGTVLISQGRPERMTCHWKSPDHQYYVMNAKFADEVFPDLTWKDEPKEYDFGFYF